MEVYGEEMFNGLACPPLDDFAFNFVSDDAAMNLDADVVFDGLIEEEEEHVDTDIPIRLKRQQPPRKGKELKRVIQVLKPTQDQLNWIAKCLKHDDQEAEAESDDDPIVNKKINNDQPNKILERKGKEDAVTKINLIKGQEEYFEKKKVMDESFNIQLKFESTKRKFHDSYQRIEDAKKRKMIQLIEFQNPMPNPKPKEAMTGSMKNKCLGGQKSYKFHHYPIAIRQY